MIILTIFEALQHRLVRLRTGEAHYILETTDISASLTRINTVAQEQYLTVFDMAAEQTEQGHRLTFRVFFSGRRNKKHHQRFFDSLAAAPETRQFRQTDSKTGSAV